MKAAALIAAALLAASTVDLEVAFADDPIPPKARKLAKRGRELHDRGDYERAIAAFKEAYVIAPSPALLFNIAQSYRLQGNCDDAALMYRRFLRSSPAYENQRIAEGHLATVDRCIAKRNLGMKLDGSMAYLEQRPAISPTDRLLRDPVPPPKSEAGERKQKIGVGLAIGGAVGIAGAIYFGVQAGNDADAVEQAYANGAKWKEIQSIDERGQRNASLAKVFGVAGGAAAAAGITLYVMGRREQSSSRITIAPTTTGAQVRLGWRF